MKKNTTMKRLLNKEEKRLRKRLEEKNMQEEGSLKGSLMTIQKVISWLR